MTYKCQIKNLYDLYQEVDQSIVLNLDSMILGDRINYILELLNLNLPLGFTTHLLIHNPLLWSDFGKDEWQLILGKAIRVKKFKYLFDNAGFLGDFVFLNKILGVNPIGLYLSVPNLDIEEKETILKSIKLVRHSMIPDSFDAECFAEGIYPDLTLLSTTQKLLVEKMGEGFSTEEDIRQYIEQHYLDTRINE